MRIVAATRHLSASRQRWAGLVALSGQQHGVVSTRQLKALGFTQQAISRARADGRLRRLHLGVYAVGGAPHTREARWIAAVLAGGHRAVLSHRDAAALWGMADHATGHVEVTVPGTGTRSQPGIRIHRTRHLPPEDVTSRCRIPVTTPARTLADLARVISRRHLQSAFDEGLRSGVLRPAALREQLVRAKGRRGAPALRAFLGDDPESIARTRSPLEARFRRFCSEESLPKPNVNAWVAGYEVDAHWPESNVIVELDSWAFHGGREAFERDRAKWADLTAAGFRIVAVTDRRLRRERLVLAATLRALLG